MVSLIDRILDGEELAVSEFYYQYSKPLLGFLRKRLPQDVAEETLNDVFLDAIDALPTLKKNTNLRALMYKIARNKTVDYYRKKKIKYVLLSQLPFLEIVAGQLNEPEFQMEKNAIRDRIEKVMYQISEKYRRILMLHYDEKIPVKDLAIIFHLSPKATESLLFRARQSFIQEYGRS